MDSDIPEIKYVLELTDKGFIKTEYVQRVLDLKEEGAIFAIKRFKKRLTKEQSFRLREISDMLTTKLAPETNNYRKIFNLPAEVEEDLREIEPPVVKIWNNPIRQNQKIKKKKADARRKKTQDRLNDEEANPGLVLQSETKLKNADASEESDEDNDDGNYVDMVRTALKDTRRILGQVTEGSALWEQIHEVFTLFSGLRGEEEEGLEQIKLGADDNVQNVGKTMRLIELPKFVNYFRVTPSDDEYFDQFIDNVSVLAEQEYYVENGITFNLLLKELHEHGFLLGCELTELEPQAVVQAQVMLQILLRLRVINGQQVYNDRVEF